MMNNRSKTLINDETFCQLCSTKTKQRLSSFFCEHCRLALCYQCYNQHEKLIEQPSLQSNATKIDDLIEKKRQLLNNFQEHCLRNLQSAFDEVFRDLENLREESFSYVQQQFSDAEIVLSEMKTNENLLDVSRRLEIFALPLMNLKISTLPRNKFDLYCQLFSSSYAPTKRFSSHQPAKIITTRCNSGPTNEFEIEKIDVETEIEEISSNSISHRSTQTETEWNSTGQINDDNDDDDDEEFYSIQDETTDVHHHHHHHRAYEYRQSSTFSSQRTISTKHEVDRIASDGEHLLYFSDTSKSLCYVTKILSNCSSNDFSTREIVCRWPHYPILDLIYCSASSQFVCATRTGVYSCLIDSNEDHSTIDIQMQLTHHWSYVRLAADKTHLWLWTDTPYSSQLRIYSPKTFECLKNFDLYDYPRFSDNSTSFCLNENRVATVFQYRNTSTSKKYFHVTFCSSDDLRELSTVRLGECDIDHEIRSTQDGFFFITNGKRKCWIVDSTGQIEFVKLNQIARALTIHTINEILIANGTKQLQCLIRHSH